MRRVANVQGWPSGMVGPCNLDQRAGDRRRRPHSTPAKSSMMKHCTTSRPSRTCAKKGPRPPSVTYPTRVRLPTRRPSPSHPRRQGRPLGGLGRRLAHQPSRIGVAAAPRQGQRVNDAISPALPPPCPPSASPRRQATTSRRHRRQPHELLSHFGGQPPVGLRRRQRRKGGWPRGAPAVPLPQRRPHSNEVDGQLHRRARGGRVRRACRLRRRRRVAVAHALEGEAHICAPVGR
ncbi:hypothetical protein BU14_0227s0011 [Porphyra umbilicalis]|uniref:Uncharacterized protein n=1 Tax=Porphyra umbilicalis TaxID=2786 RepID=A0A1X6P475_PORUM|nr:hypothetical protein BU14_0227s0011 [Porphyra umbilicalis]|eukprot:OSX75672.1 hypothetical protein BU14_0227s0011 [Porphyra umbilicalis]